MSSREHNSMSTFDQFEELIKNTIKYFMGQCAKFDEAIWEKEAQSEVEPQEDQAAGREVEDDEESEDAPEWEYINCDAEDDTPHIVIGVENLGEGKYFISGSPCISSGKAIAILSVALANVVHRALKDGYQLFLPDEEFTLKSVWSAIDRPIQEMIYKPLGAGIKRIMDIQE